MTAPNTLRSTFHWPLSGLGIGVGLLFVAVGIGIRSFADASKIPNLWLLIFDPDTPGSGKDGAFFYMGWIFILVGGLTAALFAWKKYRPIWVTHAEDEVLPELPRQAVVGEEARMTSVVTHGLVGDGREGALQPLPNPHRRAQWFMIGFALLFLPLFCQLVMLYAPAVGGANDRILKIMFCVAGCLAMVVVCSVILYAMRRGLKDLAWCRWDAERVHLGRGEEQPLEFAREELRAVQLCAAKVRSAGGDRGTQVCSGLELNLCREVDGELSRHPILLVGGELTRLLRLGEACAARLELPLAFHATAEDYRRARQRRISGIG